MSRVVRLKGLNLRASQCILELLEPTRVYVVYDAADPPPDFAAAAADRRDTAATAQCAHESGTKRRVEERAAAEATTMTEAAAHSLPPPPRRSLRGRLPSSAAAPSAAPAAAAARPALCMSALIPRQCSRVVPRRQAAPATIFRGPRIGMNRVGLHSLSAVVGGFGSYLLQPCQRHGKARAVVRPATSHHNKKRDSSEN